MKCKHYSNSVRTEYWAGPLQDEVKLRCCTWFTHTLHHCHNMRWNWSVAHDLPTHCTIATWWSETEVLHMIYPHIAPLPHDEVKLKCCTWFALTLHHCHTMRRNWSVAHDLLTHCIIATWWGEIGVLHMICSHIYIIATWGETEVLHMTYPHITPLSQDKAKLKCCTWFTHT